MVHPIHDMSHQEPQQWSFYASNLVKKNKKMVSQTSASSLTT
ncbi:MAG: hypothetical protein ACI8RD_008164 [Bacillariaceae sp.]|jgi:hypothetical protein